MKGIVNVYKPRGWSSFDVVKKLKKVYGTSHVGHLGTLDPMAEGVLAVAIGKATKLFDYYLNKDKEYEATFMYGEETDTLDAEGKVVKTSSTKVTKKMILNVIPSFIGDISQVPPKYSAIKINGKRAYELARKDEEFEIKPRNVYISSLELLESKGKEFVFRVVCSAGTYIRTLGKDIFETAGSVATMTKLVRTRVGIFDLSSSHSIEEVENNKEKCLISLQEVLKSLPVFSVPSEKIKHIKNGLRIKNITPYKEGEEFVLFIGDQVFGIAEICEGKIVTKINLYEGE